MAGSKKAKPGKPAEVRRLEAQLQQATRRIVTAEQLARDAWRASDRNAERADALSDVIAGFVQLSTGLDRLLDRERAPHERRYPRSPDDEVPF